MSGPSAAVRLATRGSPLALRQAEMVADLIRQAVPGAVLEAVVVRTEGDRRADVPLDQIGGKGVFAKAVQEAVVDGRADLAVHSAKDLPPVTPAGLRLAAVPPRADPRDALVGKALADLPTGATVATGSSRRRSQLANLRPDLTFVTLRGNMATRLARVEDGAVDAVVVAAAAMDRLGWQGKVAERLAVGTVLPQVGQGALAVECRADDEDAARVLDAVDDRLAHRTLDAERALLAALAGSCVVPAGGWAEPADGGAPDGLLRLHGMVGSGDGRVVVWASMLGDEPDALGRALAHHLLVDCGGAGIAEWAPGDGGPIW